MFMPLCANRNVMITCVAEIGAIAVSD